MATNPLFQGYRKQEVFHTKTLNKCSFKNTVMAQRLRDQPGSKRGGTGQTEEGKPQPKRQRLGNPPDDAGDWDDSFEFTQQELETLDVVASQAIGEPSTSKQETESYLEHGDTEQTLELESASFIVTEGQGQQSLFQAPAPGATVRLKNRSSTSSSSESSVYPQSSASLRKTSTSDLSSIAGSLTSSKSSSNRSSEDLLPGEIAVVTPGMSTKNGAAGNVVTVKALREDLRKKAEEAQKARSELYAREGEVKFLKDSLHKQEAELEKLRAEREEWKDAEQRHQKEREKELKQEVERLQTQVQFKTQDYVQLQQRCHMLESKLTHQQSSSPLVAQPSTSTGGVTTSQPQGSPDKSPKVRKVVRGNRTPEKGAFPSHHSFMSTAVVSSPGVPAHTTRSRETMTTEDLQASVPSESQGRVRQCQHRLKLNVPCPGGKTPSTQLVSQLLQCSCSTSGEIEDSGILGLLQMLPSRHDLTELQYERDGATARLSPVKKARRQSSPGVYVPLPLQPAACKSILEREHFLLAAHGLRNLVDFSSHSTQPKASMSEQTQPPQPSGAVLLLPMLNDYLSHYLDILSSSSAATPNVASPNLSSSSNKSSSCEAGSSLESMTSSLVMLFQQGSEYANCMETLTLCALRVLHTLVCICDDVRSVCVRSRVGASLLQPTTDTSSSTIETDHEKDKANESGMEGDDEQSTPSSKDSSIISPEEPLGSPAHQLQGLNLLIKLLRLASPGHQSSGFKGAIVEAALDILIALANNLPDVDVARLHVIILRGVLADCLQQDQQPSITVRALDLFSSLVQSRSILPFLCTKTDTCTLLNVHLVSTRFLAISRGKQQPQPLLLHLISKVVDSVSSVVSFHRNGVHFLIDNNCRCSRQFIPSLVHAMFYLLREYQVSDGNDVLGVLRKGVLLLHDISLQDPNYQQSHSIVHMHYSTLMSGLTSIYRRLKSLDALPQEEVSALEDLWEEVDESDTGSQDSDAGEPMVVE